VTRLRAALAAPLRLAPVDLLAAIVVAVVGISLAAGPALSQEPGASPLASVIAAASPAASAPPGSAAPDTAAPAASPAAGSAARATAAPAPVMSAQPATASPAAGATPTHSLPPGATAEGDPCAPRPTPDPSATPNPDATAPPPHNLCPAQPNGADPMALLAWLFTPIFQAIFLGLVFLYSITGDIGIAIILLTIIMRILLIPVFRAQIVSQRRMQMLQPELRAISVKYKGDRARISAEQMQLYKDRGVNPAAGCLPSLVQLALLLPMYQVFTQGLTAPDISSMLSPFGVTLVDIQCQDPGNPYAPCIDSNVPWLGWLPVIDSTGFHMPGYPGGMPANLPEVFLSLSFLFGLGLSILAVVSALLQLVQTRMMTTPSDDPQQRSQQRIFLLLPLFSLVYGGILPAGLFIYWITTTVFSIVQQYLINGYGGLFPLFGWTPGFARDHTPRFPVRMPEPKPRAAETGTQGTTQTSGRSATESAAGTIRPARRRSNRRGRRR
jgi:YidC/Oxa1 family membrane protein insertase